MNFIEIIQNQFAISQNGISVSWAAVGILFLFLFLWGKIFTPKLKK